MKNIVVLGSTGSIGTQALKIIENNPDEYRLLAIGAGKNKDLILQQVKQFQPKYVASLCQLSKEECGISEYLKCPDGLNAIASLPEADVIINGISGFSALEPLLYSLKAGKRVALANKESIVCGKSIVDSYLKEYHGEIIPVDSEQSAIFQCMKAGEKKEIKNLILTASGGRFWNKPFEELKNITVEEALNHPTWKMGTKITIDSATLFNKGLEVIEASYLFDVPGPQIKVVIHPQSVVHSMVEFKDNTVIANLSCPNMQLPIQYAVTYPERQLSLCKPLNFDDYENLSFYTASKEKYPALRLAYSALESGGTMPTVFNASNEQAVAAFISKKIRFTDIYSVVEDTMSKICVHKADSIDTINEIDALSRRISDQIIKDSYTHHDN